MQPSTAIGVVAHALSGVMFNKITAEESLRRSTLDADGFLPSDHIMEAIKAALSRVPGITLYEVEA